MSLSVLRHGNRHETADVQLEHASISRFHAMVCFRATDGAVCVMDMSSAHGTVVNGRPCKQVRGVVAHAVQTVCQWPSSAASLRTRHYYPQDQVVELKDGAELRFGASTRVYVLKRPPPARKRSVSWPDGER